MRLLRGAARAAALLGIARRQDEPPADSVVVKDAETGFTFGQFAADNGVTYRIALPSPIPDPVPDAGYDAVAQIVAPIGVGWAGLAWGGSMTYNPLTIAWRNGNDVVVSSRMAFGYYVPPAYADAKYTTLAGGTHVNDTHWQVTVQCSGCTHWGDADTGVTTLDPKVQNPLAFAFSQNPPDTPSDPASAFSIHDGIGHWYHDFGNIGNDDFDALVAKNSGGGGNGTAPAAPSGGNATKPHTSPPAIRAAARERRNFEYALARYL